MKKPTIKNWIKYCAGTLAVSGMLLTTSCDTNNKETADYETETEAAETEPAVTARENVADVEPEAEEEVENVAEQPQTTQTQQAADRSAGRMPNMDNHLEEHKEENKAIKEELTDVNLKDQDTARQDVANTQDTYQYNTADEQQNPTQQTNRLGEPQGNVQDTATNQQQDEYGTLVIERYSVIIPETYTEEERQRMEDIMAEYGERRESMRGQINPETGAYLSPEQEAQPMGMNYEQLINELENRVEYPHNAIAAEMEGTVFVRFVVDENGQVRNAEVADAVIASEANRTTTTPLNPNTFDEQEIEQVKEELKKEAVRAVESTSGEWQSAMQGGQAVAMEMQLPVSFRLKDAGPVDNR